MKCFKTFLYCKQWRLTDSCWKNFRDSNAISFTQCHLRTPLSKITSTGEIEQRFRRAASMKVVQFLKLDACQSDGCVLWQQNFVVQCKDQLTVSLIYAILIRWRFNYIVSETKSSSILKSALPTPYGMGLRRTYSQSHPHSKCREVRHAGIACGSCKALLQSFHPSKRVNE